MAISRTFCAGVFLSALLYFGASTSLFAQPPDDSAAVVQGNNRFAFDLYHKLRTSNSVTQNNGNLIFSPYSISTAMGMVYAGARGTTAQEIADVFHFGLSQDRLHPAYGTLIRDLNGPHRTGYQLSIANRLWGQTGYPIHQPFLDTNRNHYGAELGRLDFAGDTENSRQTINHWVEEQTNERIKDLIPQGGVMDGTRLVLTNAIYFLGDWKHSFNKDATTDRAFAVDATQQIRVPTMFQNGHFRYADGGDFQMLELPYKGDQLSMLLVLPKAGGRADGPASAGLPVGGTGIDYTFPEGQLVSLLNPNAGAVDIPVPFHPIPSNSFAAGPIGIGALASLEAGLTPDVLQAAMDNLSFRDVNLYLPKFRLETAASLGETLSQMGMPSAFSGDADLSGIADERLQITGVLHKAFIELDEDGTEAAAATGIIVGTTSVFQPPPPILFNADHPFHFLIRDNLTGSTLFMGRVARPEGEIVAIPEPSSVVLAVIACACIVLVHRRCIAARLTGSAPTNAVDPFKGNRCDTTRNSVRAATRRG